MVLYACVWTHWLQLLCCSGAKAVEAGMCSTVRRLFIGYFILLSKRLYYCSSQRKSRGWRIISWLIPIPLISQHPLPQPLIWRRVNFFSSSLYFGLQTLFPFPPLFRSAQYYHQSFPEGWSTRHGKREGESYLLWNSQERVVSPPDGRENKRFFSDCTKSWNQKINKAAWLCTAVGRL